MEGGLIQATDQIPLAIDSISFNSVSRLGRCLTHEFEDEGRLSFMSSRSSNILDVDLAPESAGTVSG